MSDPITFAAFVKPLIIDALAGKAFDQAVSAVVGKERVRVLMSKFKDIDATSSKFEDVYIHALVTYQVNANKRPREVLEFFRLKAVTTVFRQLYAAGDLTILPQDADDLLAKCWTGSYPKDGQFSAEEEFAAFVTVFQNVASDVRTVPEIDANRKLDTIIEILTPAAVPVSSQVTPKMNPFGHTGIVSAPYYFVREALTRKVVDELTKGQSVSITGERKFGKSSFLEYLRTTDRLSNVFTDRHSLSLQSMRSDEQFYEALCYELSIPKQTSAFMLGRRLEKDNRSVLLCLDEIEAMLDGQSRSGKTGFTLTLRHNLRHLTEKKIITFAIASQLPLDHLFPDSPTQASPLANLCVSVPMPTFSLNELQLFVQSQLGQNNVLLPLLSEIYLQTGGRPAKFQQRLKNAYEDHYGR